MRTSLMDFTRGSQVAETIAMMFGTAVRPLIWTALTIVAALTSWLVWRGTNPGDSYYWIMHLYASAWTWIEFSPHHLVGLKTLTQGTVMVHISDVTTYPPLQAAWQRLWSAVSAGVLYGLLLGLPLAVVSIVLLRRFGSGLTRRRYKRGSRLVSAVQLAADIDAYNRNTGRPDRRNDTRRILGKHHWHQAPFASRRDLVAAGMYEPYRLAGVPYPWRTEQSHTMLVGTTGTGKSTAMKDLLWQIRDRDGRAIVFDLTGTYVESFYNPETDFILNPFDARCPKWSPFADAHTREHFKEASLALVPIPDGGGDQFWPESARMLFVEVCVKLVQQGRGNNQALSDVLMTSKLKDLHAHVLKTVAAPLTDPEAKRMAESIRATFNTYAQALGCLPETGTPFSVRDWVLASDGETDEHGNHTPAPGSILFIAAQHVNLRSVRVLLTMWLTTAINTLMSMPGDQLGIRLWLLLDEINAMHNIPAIVSGMQTARNYGGAFVLGVHTIAQLKETYGDNLAEMIASLAKTKLLMATKDKGTQEWESAQIGEGETTEMEENFSYGVSNVRDAATLQRKVKLEPLVLFSEFQDLLNLTGYIKFAEGMPAALIRLTYVRYAKHHRGFIEREITPLAPPETPVLALPYYIVRDGVTVTRDGEIVDHAGTTGNTATGAPNSPPSDATDGYQTAPTTATGVPERLHEKVVEQAQEIANRWVQNQIDAGRLDVVVDPKSGSSSQPAEISPNSAVRQADQQRRGVDDKTLAEPVNSRGRETVADGLVIQEQRQYLGEAEKERHRHDRAQGNNVTAAQVAERAAEADRGNDGDESMLDMV